MKVDTSKHTSIYIVGHLDWPTRLRFFCGLVLAVVIFSSIGSAVLRPWDPEGAISLLLVDSKVYLLVRLSAVVLAVAVLSTIVFDGRLTQFGTFVACVGLAIPVLKTGGMDYLMVRLQAGVEFEDPASQAVLWGELALEMLAWLVPLGAMVIGSALTERWVRNDRESGETKSQGPGGFARGILGTILTASAAIGLIVLLSASREKGQVIFAVSAAFFLASWLGDWFSGNRHPFWQVAAVPLVGLCVYTWTWMNPSRPAGSEAILHLAPNNLVAILPIEYICAGVAAAIFGTWTSERLRFSKSHG